MPRDVMRTIASVGSWISGSGTVSTRTSRFPCHVSALIASPSVRRSRQGRWPIRPSSSLIPFVRCLLAVAGALGADARHVLRGARIEDLALLVRHLPLRAASREALAEALHPAKETVHDG